MDELSVTNRGIWARGRCLERSHFPYRITRKATMGIIPSHRRDDLILPILLSNIIINYCILMRPGLLIIFLVVIVHLLKHIFLEQVCYWYPYFAFCFD